MTEQFDLFPELTQGTEEWLQLRKTKITATDAAVIMGMSKWKTATQLYYEKKSPENKNITTPAMQRGITLEPFARSDFTLKTGINVSPKVVIKDWAMASLDGITDNGDIIVEIKCPGQIDHEIALNGEIPKHYIPQLQHQMYVCDRTWMYYYSFDGKDGVIVKSNRDDVFIEKMVKAEKEFYQCLIENTPTEPSEKDFHVRNDPLWVKKAMRWQEVNSSIKQLQKEEEELRNSLIDLSGNSNVMGAGISLCHVQRKGAIDYSKIEFLKDIDLELYRKEPTTCCRISTE